ncbi:DNA-directed RNA polymerase subunit delta [Xylocopilactobacillus apicola]|uniref:Probable DNA-directed RNA polymerase subunit delta n=1 Tax=Xylocopilactobacillus apicola TaxID=2932184 RepID=A0AAU9D7V2_9LACO|nr:DNA-directed RNA polymerase subunit delta [Xylocopilactobacillus apicola]BDR58466.1 hypothetical protein XA3_09070 [Xylocopilactobacillus apicola]
MELTVFEKQNKSELSMIEVAYAILKNNEQEMEFKNLYREVGKYLGKKKKELDNAIVDFYTDLNVDGSFISLGNDLWGLREWYPFESVDEETNHNEDLKEMSDKNLSNYDEDDDVIDYADEDPDAVPITDQFPKSSLSGDDFLEDEENQVEENPQSADEALSSFEDDDSNDSDF